MTGRLERAARAIWEWDRERSCLPVSITPIWENTPEDLHAKVVYRAKARAALAAADAWNEENGLVVVPREPTEGMVKAAARREFEARGVVGPQVHRLHSSVVYRAMLTAWESSHD